MKREVLSNKKIKKIIFDDNMKRVILDIFDKSVDEDGYIIENETGDRVLTPKGDEVKLENFVGFTPGSEIVLTNDLPSLIQYVDVKTY